MDLSGSCIIIVVALLVRLTGIEPVLPAPEADALSPELQAHAKIATLIIVTQINFNASIFTYTKCV